MPSPEDFLPLPAPHVLSVLFARDREAFTHPSEVYDSWVVLGLMEGRFRYSFGRSGAEELCETGEFVVCPPEVLLRRKALGKVSFYFIRFRWKGSMIREWQGKQSLVDLARMESTLSHLEKISSHPEDGREQAWANHLLLDFFQQRRQERSHEALKIFHPDKQMIRVAEKMRKELAGTFSLNGLADELRLTPSQLSRRFKAAFGSNPSLYRTRLRMQEARRLLVESTLSLEQIAEVCGYENAFYFSRVFHAQNGRPPSQFRKSMRV